MRLPPIPDEDRQHILRYTADLWPQIANARFFITGGTGFYGKWLLESIAAANDLLGAKIRATILSRNPARFALEVPHLASRAEFAWLAGDAADFAFPDGRFDYVLHFATASAAQVGAGGTAMIMHTLRGTERVLQFTKSAGARRLFFASSGAVYGRQPAELSHMPEDYRGAPDPTDPTSGYGEMKRLCEFMCAASGIDCVFARGFSFVGPYLPLTDKFAVGSFIRDALAGGPIRIHGDGTPVRSYLYAADLAVWLLTILVRGAPFNAYNLGSEDPVTLYELACLLASRTGPPPGLEVVRAGAETASTRYVPATRKAAGDLGLSTRIPLGLAMQRTMSWALATVAHPRSSKGEPALASRSEVSAVGVNSR